MGFQTVWSRMFLLKRWLLRISHEMGIAIRKYSYIVGLIVLILNFDLKGQKIGGIYSENYRPQFHFSPPENWMNDPNGLFFLDGEYHMFYQYNPNGKTWGPMHWGHAISKDLIYWQNMPIALYPDEQGMIFSGSAVFDEYNSSGLGTLDNPPLVAVFTYHDSRARQAGSPVFQTQGLAFSLDKGRTWNKYTDNPVLKNEGYSDFRDPKVIWLKNKWIMSLAVKDRIQFYSSPNLIDWNLESEFSPDWASKEGVWECPDLFPLLSEDGVEKWVLLVSVISGAPQRGSGTQYFVGDFDGNVFKSDDEVIRWLDYGSDNYAGVTWSNIPDEDGRKIFIGWMSNWYYAQKVPTQPWRSSMTLPRELTLTNRNNHFLLKSIPVSELKKLRKSSSEQYGSRFELEEELVELELFPNTEDFSIEISNSLGDRIFIEKNGGQLIFDRSKSGVTDFVKGFGDSHKISLKDTRIEKVQVFLDRSSIEVFINDGMIAMSNLLFPNKRFDQIRIVGFKNKNMVHYLNSIWGSELRNTDLDQ